MSGKWVGTVLGAAILLSVILGSCSLESESSIACGISFDASLLDDPPEDTVFINFDASDFQFKRRFSGLRKAEVEGNPVDGAYENLRQTGRSPGNFGEELRGLGVTIINPGDSSEATLSFNLQEVTAGDAVCRRNKTLQDTHDWSRWTDNVQGAELLLTIRITGEWVTFSTDTEQDEDFLIDLEGAELLDDAGIFARIQGSFRGNMVQIDPEVDDPMVVEVNGTFIVNTQVGYLF